MEYVKAYKYVVHLGLSSGTSISVNKIGWDNTLQKPEMNSDPAVILERLIIHIDRLRGDGNEYLVIPENDYGTRVGIRAIKHANIITIHVEPFGVTPIDANYIPNILW